MIPVIVLAEIVFVVERRRHDIDVGEVLDRIADADNSRDLTANLAQSSLARQMILVALYGFE